MSFSVTGPGTVLPMAEPLTLLTGTMLGLVLAVMRHLFRSEEAVD